MLGRCSRDDSDAFDFDLGVLGKSLDSDTSSSWLVLAVEELRVDFVDSREVAHVLQLQINRLSFIIDVVNSVSYIEVDVALDDVLESSTSFFKHCNQILQHLLSQVILCLPLLIIILLPAQSATSHNRRARTD